MKYISDFLKLVSLLYSSIACGQYSWTQKANFTGNFHWQSVGFSIADKGYVGTGTSNPGNLHNEFWQYDTTNNTWTQKASLPVVLEEAVGFSIGNKGYIGTGDTAFWQLHCKHFFEYNPDSNSWTAKAPFGGTERGHAFAFSINGKGYIGGGYDIDSIKNDMWEYDPIMDTWVQKADLPITGISGAIAFVANSRAYVGIGHTYQGYTQLFFEYNPITDTWTQKANFSGSARHEAVAFAIGNRGYVGTGLDPTNLNDFWQYNPTNDSWMQLDSFPGTPRYDAIGFSIGHAGYLGIGANAMDFYKFSPPPPEETGIQESDHYQIELFPNPSTELITIITEESVADISIMNSLSKIVRHQNKFQDEFHMEMDLTGLESGIYFVIIHFNNGQTRIAKTLYYRQQ